MGYLDFKGWFKDVYSSSFRMAQSFLGLRVSLSLNTGLSIEGKVSHIDSNTQLLTLSDVLIFLPGQATQRAPLYGVNGSDIKDLQILPESTSLAPPTTTVTNTQQQNQAQQQPHQLQHSQAMTSAQRQTMQDPSSALQASPSRSMSHPPPPPSVRPKSIARTDGAGGDGLKQVVYDARAKKVDESSATESVTTTKPQKKKTRQIQTEAVPQQSKNSRRTKNGRKANVQPVHEWAGGDVNDFKEEEFDFQANLDMFDKAKVFAEIREMDETAPETRLVTINRLPQPGRGAGTTNNNGSSPNRVNLLPSENVLDEQIDPGALSDDSLTSEGVEYMRGKRRGSKPSQRSKIVVMSSGILCPVVTSQQITTVEQECGLDRDQLIENAGRVSSMMAIQTLGGNRRNSDHSTAPVPVVVILAGNNTIGAYGFSAGRHLVNQGCTVIACTGSMPPYQSMVATHQKMFEHAGGRTISSLTQLPNTPVDLIIDALMGAQYNYKNLMHEKKAQQLTSSLISWANANAAPILSLDFPSGNQTAQDCSSQGPHRIHPKWTVCLGAPKTGCTSRDITGELYMGDLGIPRVCWKRAGVKGGSMPWGAEFLVALEYV
ncbi:hypothetical protein INT43_004016 [Umbelopsis isabellina]|uniref:Enhancer of mRNA-decapping protein 3 n=1 Tax=Mortierella isabellina TaxID=91625 RepID=A0A8H7PTW1_MORIS|nr:hypothetical protein INT43_004016 [Umbelopsis isabellina]